MSDSSRKPPIAMFSVRGIGVAVSVSTSTSARSCFSCSLSLTPKRCSSSMMTRPSRPNFTPLCSSRCVPITMSIWPASRPCSTCSTSRALRKRDSASTLHRPVGEAVGERLVVLLGEQCRRHQHRDLLAGLNGDERRAQRDFGLAEADVAAHDAIHRLGAGEIGDDLLDGLRLIGRLLELEGRLECAQVGFAGDELFALTGRASRVQIEQLGRGVVDALRGLALGLVPGVGAELVQRRCLRRRAGVAADQVERVHRHVQLVAVRVFEQQELVGQSADVECRRG